MPLIGSYPAVSGTLGDADQLAVWQGGVTKRATVSQLPAATSGGTTDPLLAVAGGTIDATSALQASLAAIPAGGTWELPAGRFLISGTSTEILLRTTSVHIKGSLHGTVFVLAPTIGSSTDIIRLAPAGTGLAQSRDYSIEGISFDRTSTTPVGRHLIHVDVSAASGRFIEGLRICNNYLGSANYGGPSTNGKTIALTPFSGSTASAIFRSYIRDNDIVGPVNLDGAGDSVFVSGNIIASTGDFVFNGVPGAGQFVFENNNVSIAGGVIIRRCVNPIIRGNEFEQQVTTTNARGAMLDLFGDVGRIDCALIEANLFQSNPGLGVSGAAAPTFIRIGTCSNPIITSNRFGQSGGVRVAEISIDSAAANTLIKTDNRFFSQSGFSTVPLTIDSTGTTSIGDTSKANVNLPIFTGSVTTSFGGPVQWSTIVSSAATGNRNHATYYDGVTCSFIIASDDFSASKTWLTMSRTGQTVNAVQVPAPFNFGVYTSGIDPTTSNLLTGQAAVWKNSGSGVVKLWVNDGGTLKSVALA